MLQKLDRAIYEKYANEGQDTAPLDQLPYFLRCRALDQPLAPHELGRALYHLAQRRGYLSNRKSGKADEDRGTVEPAIHELRERMSAAGVRTLGEFLSRVDPQNERRIRRQWTARAMYLHEFEAIWDAQKKHHPKLLTDALKEEVHCAIFDQRPLKSQKGLVSYCEFVPGKRRAPRALLNAQRFRMLQKVNDLEVIAKDESRRKLTPEERETLLDEMERQKEISFPGIRKLIKPALKGTEFNFERGGEKKLPGNKTAAALRAVFGDRWDEFPRHDQDAIVGEVMGIEKAEVPRTPAAARPGASTAKPPPPSARSTSKPATLLSPAKPSKPSFRKWKRASPTRPPAMKSSNSPAARTSSTGFPPVVEACKTIRNPVVMRTLTETRRVVNGIIRKHGKPVYIRIELAREMKKSREDRKKITSDIKKRERANEDLRARIQKETGNPRVMGRDLLKARLWTECNGECPYTGNPIPFRGLFSDDSPWDIEHIIPFSRCLDDSYYNKTLCYHEENRNVKRNRTPREAYEGTDHWDAMIERVKRFQGDAARDKLRRFQMQKHELQEFDDFSARQLNDTKYASREAAKYLSWL